MDREPAFVVERPRLGPLDRRLLPRERGDDAVIAANDERQIIDHVGISAVPVGLRLSSFIGMSIALCR